MDGEEGAEAVCLDLDGFYDRYVTGGGRRNQPSRLFLFPTTSSIASQEREDQLLFEPTAINIVVC